MEYYLITFSNTHTAIAIQKHLEGKLNFQVMPTLREISASCGISLRIETDTLDILLEALKSFPAGKELYQIYFIRSGQIIKL